MAAHIKTLKIHKIAEEYMQKHTKLQGLHETIDPEIEHSRGILQSTNPATWM